MWIGDWLDSFVISLIVVLIVVAVVTLVSGIDEFFLDLVYLFRVLPRRGSDLRGEAALAGARSIHTEKSLNALPEQPIAVMIPAWNESAVIRKMLENTIQSLRYSNYHIFVGTYPNDDGTRREVELVRSRYDHVHAAVCPADGPTNKADCLNSIFGRILEFEQANKIRFEIVVQHDAEDLVHPYSLKIFNFYQPTVDMVQLPVFALETDWREFTGCHYVDEFCEHHIKSIPVRELLSGSVPSAGVGCGFSRHALDQMLAKDESGRLFNDGSLTEDYDFATRLSIDGFDTRFIRPVLRRKEIREKGWFRKQLVEEEREEIISTREYFPDELRPAVRQKSRWILGISIQGWQQIGWRGGFWNRYMLLRDRKTLLTSQVNVLGYLVLAGFFFLYVLQFLYPDELSYPGIVETGTWLWYVILADTFFLVWRLILRAHCVYVVYGWAQALWSAPRLVWGNFISFFATTRAIWLWLRAKLFGRPFTWEKTMHVFPTDEKISSFRQRLGDLLIERKHIRFDQLEQALAAQKQTGRPLGEILLAMGVLSERDLFRALGAQWQIEDVEIDPMTVPITALQLVGRETAEYYSVFPLEVIDGSRIRLAADRLLSREDVDAIERALNRRVELVLTTRTGLREAIAQGFARLDRPGQKDSAAEPS